MSNTTIGFVLRVLCRLIKELLVIVNSCVQVTSRIKVLFKYFLEAKQDVLSVMQQFYLSVIY